MKDFIKAKERLGLIDKLFVLKLLLLVILPILLIGANNV